MGPETNLPSMELSAPLRGEPWARGRVSWRAPWGGVGTGGARVVVREPPPHQGGPESLLMFVQKINKEAGGGWDFKSTCALGRPNPAKGSALGHPRYPSFPTGFCLPRSPPHIQSLYHRVQPTHLTDGKTEAQRAAQDNAEGSSTTSPPHSLWPVCPFEG